jgi:hypothetical protein
VIGGVPGREHDAERPIAGAHDLPVAEVPPAPSRS